MTDISLSPRAPWGGSITMLHQPMIGIADME